MLSGKALEICILVIIVSIIFIYPYFCLTHLRGIKKELKRLNRILDRMR